MNLLTLYKRNKEGIMYGAIVGAVAFFYYYNFVKETMQQAMLQVVNQQSVFNDVTSQFAPTLAHSMQLAPYLMFVAFVLFFAAIGFLIDMLHKPKV